MWLNRLPKEYKRRYYTNLGFIAGVIVWFYAVAHVNKHVGTILILVTMAALALWTCIFPALRLARAEGVDRRKAYLFYAAWIAAYAYTIAATLFSLPGIMQALLLGAALMWAFFVIYRKQIFSDFFSGKFTERWHAIREAQRAERESFPPT